MNPVFGIHVGNTRACLAVFKQDDVKSCVEVTSDNAGDRVMPAMVTVTEVEDVVGVACKSLMASRWATTITCNKGLLNEDRDEEPSDVADKVLHHRSTAKTVDRDGQICYELPLGDRTEYRTPSDIATLIYRSLLGIAKSAASGLVGDISCVLMVPEWFSENARFKVRSAAEAAGWDVMQVISEPSGAVLGLDLLGVKMPPPRQTALVFRVGGRTCDVTVMDLDHGMITVLDSEVSEQANGDLLIRSLVDFLAEEFYKKYKLDPRSNRRALIKLTLAAENCLQVLSSVESATCFIESLCDGVDFSHTVSRARFDSIILPFLPLFSQPIFTVINRLDLTPEGVSALLLCGGPMKIPRLRKYITDVFSESRTRVVLPPDRIGFDEVLACGAARQAGLLRMEKIISTFFPSRITVPVLGVALKLQVQGAEADDLELPEGLPLPFRKDLSVRQPQGGILLTFFQSSLQNLLQGQVQLDRDTLGSEELIELSLEIDIDTGITVSVPIGTDEVKHFPVKMFASDANFDGCSDTLPKLII